jgi:hypothetical protein
MLTENIVHLREEEGLTKSPVKGGVVPPPR